MSESLIAGFDGSPQAQRAADYAADAVRKAGSTLYLVHIIEWSPYSFHTPEELAERKKRHDHELDRANEMLKPVQEAISKKGVSVEVIVRHGNAGELLCRTAEEKNAGGIIIGRTGDSILAQRLLGGLAITLAQIAPVPLTIVP